MRGAARRFTSDKSRIASTLNGLKNDLFYTHQNFENRCCRSRENRDKSFVIIHMCFITYNDTATVVIFFVLTPHSI